MQTDFFDKMFFLKYQTKNYLRYLYALLAVPIVILSRFALLPLAHEGTPFITLFPATVIIALLGGMGPAILTGVIGVMFADYYFIPPLHSWDFGIEFWTRTSVVVLTSVFVGYVGAVLREARLRAENQAMELYQSRGDLNRAQTVSHTGSWRLDARSNKLTWSDEAYRIFGVTLNTPLTYESFLSFIHPDDREYVNRKWDDALKGEKYDIEHRIKVNGKVKWVREKAELEYEKSGTLTSGFGTVTDITDQKQREEELKRLNRTLRALSKSIQAIMHAKDEQKYLRDICDIIINDCGHAMVWIGYAENDESKSVKPVACSGFEEGYLETLKITWADNERGRGPTGTSIRTGEISFCRNIPSNPAFEPWRKDALKRGYASSISLPLLNNEKAFGALTIYSREPDPFTSDEVNLLTELAGDISLGISTIRLRIARDEAEVSLRESQQRLSLALRAGKSGVWDWDLSTEKAWWSPEMYELWGVVYGTEMNTDNSMSLIDVRDRNRVREQIEECIATHRNLQYEFRILNPYSGERWMETFGNIIYNESGNPIHIIGITLDITERKRVQFEREVTIDFLDLVNKSTGTRDLIQLATAFFQEQTGCEAVGIRIKDGEDYPYYETSGFSKQFVHLENSLCAKDLNGQLLRDEIGNPMIECMCGNVICGRTDPSKSFFTKHGSFWSNCTTDLLASTTDTDRQTHTRNRCNGMGYESVALLPLIAGEERFGLLQLNDKKKGRFSPELIDLWERLADYMAVAFAKLRAEESLRQNEATLRGILDATKESIWLFSADGKVLMGNPTALSRFKNPADEILGKHISTFLPPDLAKSRLARLQEVVKSVRPLEFEDTRDDIIFHHSFYPVQDSQGRVTSIVSFSRDITEGKHVQDAIRESERNYRELVQNANSAIIRWDRDGHITLFNEYAQQFFGYSSQEVIGRAVDFLLPDGDSNEINPSELIANILNDPEHYANNINENVCRDGRRVWMAWANKPIYDENGQVSEILAVGTDVTKRREMEEELRKSRDELEIRVKERTAELEKAGLKIQSERQRFNDVLETLPVYVCLLTPDYYMPFANKVFRDLFGYYPDKKCYEFLFNRSEPCENCETYKVLKTNQPQHWEWMGPNGRNYDIFDFPFRDTDGSQLILEMGIDITERKQAENAVRQGEERYRSLTEATTQIVWTTDPQGQVVSDMPLWREFTGQSVDEIQGWGWINALHPDDREQTARIWTKAVQEKTLYETEYRIRRRDGEYRYVSVRGIPVLEQNGPIREWIGTCTDITEQKLAQEALRSASIYSRSLLEASLDPLVTISADGKITDVNEATVQVTGVSREELIGTDFSNYFTEPDNAREGYQKVFAQGFVTDYPLTIRHKNGKLTDVLYNATVYKNEDGEVQGIFAAARDITVQKQASQYARGLLEASLDPLVTISSEGKITDVNEATVQATGVSRENLIGTDFSNYFTEPDKARESYQQVFAKGFVTDYPLTILHRDGHLTNVLYNATVYKNTHGETAGVFAAARDVTEKKQAEEKQNATNSILELYARKAFRGDYLNAAVNVIRGWSKCSRVGIRIKDEEGNIPYESSVGFEKNFIDLENPLHLQKDSCLCIRAIMQKPDLSDRELLTPGGSFYSNDSLAFVDKLTAEQAKSYRGQCMEYGFQSLGIIPIRYRNDVLGAIHIADTKKNMVPLLNIEFIESTIAPLIGEAIHRFNAEAELEKYRMHLEDIVKQRTDELARSNKDLEQFAYVASHDLQEPLRAVSGFVSLLQRQLQDSLTDKTKEYMHFTIDGVHRMQSLINGLLEYSRIDTRKTSCKNRFEQAAGRRDIEPAGQYSGI